MYPHAWHLRESTGCYKSWSTVVEILRNTGYIPQLPLLEVGIKLGSRDDTSAAGLQIMSEMVL